MAIHPARHIGLKILSLILAVALWFVVAREEISEALFRAPLEFVNVPASMEIAGDPPSEVQVRVRAAATTVRRIYETGLVARCDLQGARPGTHRIVLGAANMALPFGCQVIRISPASFDLSLEERGTKTVPVTARIEGTVADGYDLSVSTSPTRVTLEGPKSRVMRIGSVSTQSVQVEGLTSSTTQVAGLVVPDPSCRPSEVSSVEVLLTVVEKQESRVFDGVIAEAIPASRQAALWPERIRVRVEGPLSKVRGIGSDDIRARIDVSALAPGQYSLQPEIVFSRFEDNSLHVVELQPDRIRVTVR